MNRRGFLSLLVAAPFAFPVRDYGSPLPGALMKSLYSLFLVLACSGEVFHEADHIGVVSVVGGESAEMEPALPLQGMVGSIGGAAGSVAALAEGGMGEHEPGIPEGGSPILGFGGSDGSSGGQGEGGSDIIYDWGCHFEGGVCQCYSDRSQFMPEWLNANQCADTRFCATRDKSACVCWSGQDELESFMTVMGTERVKACPPI